MCSIASKFGMTAERLRLWVRRAEVDGRTRPSVTSEEKERIRRLEWRIVTSAGRMRSSKRRQRVCAGARPATAQAVTVIHTHGDRWGIEPICRVLSFAPSTYDAVISRPPSVRRIRDEALKPRSRAFSRSTVGWTAPTRYGHS